MIKAIERFHIYLYGLRFTVVTDYHALVYVVNKAYFNPRISRWILRLQNYKFKVIQDRCMVYVDALSRVIVYLEPMPLESELAFKQLHDPRLKTISEGLELKNNDKFELIEGLVFRKDIDKLRFVIPDSMINNVIRVYHNEIAHCGVEKIWQGISSDY